MIKAIKNICQFRRDFPGIKGNALKVNDPKIDDVKGELEDLKFFLEKKFSIYNDISFKIEVSQGQSYFPFVIHACILPPQQKVSDGIYAVICFDKYGKGVLAGCAESITNPKGLETVKRKKKGLKLDIDVDGNRPTTKYNNTFANPVEYYDDAIDEQNLLDQLRTSLDLALHHLSLLKSERLPVSLRINSGASEDFDPKNIGDAREIITRQIKARRGQTKFRKSLLEAYEYKCCVSSMPITEILEAAHIIPYNGSLTNHVQNGLLLRSDLHTLFDLGLMTIDSIKYRVLIHDTLKGTIYYTQFHNSELCLPKNKKDFPSKDALRHHMINEFKS